MAMPTVAAIEHNKNKVDAYFCQHVVIMHIDTTTAKSKTINNKNKKSQTENDKGTKMEMKMANMYIWEWSMTKYKAHATWQQTE